MIVEETKSYPYKLLLEADPSIPHIKEYISKGKCYVAKEDGEVIGVYVLLPIESSITEIKNIAVKETWRDKGIGKKLIKDALQRAEKNGMKSVEIGTGNSSIGQLALYQKCGFRISEIVMGFFDDYPEEIMEDGIRCRDMIRLSYSI
ncbi:GNAT family N-acetyltransferase [Pseudalkalibacillus hwajinpoensis]|uniref:GNAT family N-acetyltransferase n=1 Tax=Guptibacillus hwajinpoensis TaxID=208199 RepID=UPI00325B8290